MLGVEIDWHAVSWSSWILFSFYSCRRLKSITVLKDLSQKPFSSVIPGKAYHNCCFVDTYCVVQTAHRLTGSGIETQTQVCVEQEVCSNSGNVRQSGLTQKEIRRYQDHTHEHWGVEHKSCWCLSGSHHFKITVYILMSGSRGGKTSVLHAKNWAFKAKDPPTSMSVTFGLKTISIWSITSILQGER